MIAFETGFYVTGGTLRRDTPSYVERQADTDLYTSLRQGEFCYVLTARQMGKSSLMVRTAARLREEGVAVANFELTALGQNLTAEQWYEGLLGNIGQELELEEELERFWLEHERLGPLQRWLRALREVVLARHPGSVVICLDEIDAVRSLPFPTDEFFAAIRECYNRRSEDAAFHRLTFCLLGVFTPSDLIQDTRTTPFNIGRRIELTDFSEAEAAPLARGLGTGDAEAQALLKRILHWTGGHPYLTQRLCQAVAESVGSRQKAVGSQDGTRGASSELPTAYRLPGPGPTPSAPPSTGLVDRLCAELFLSHGARERDDNLLFVRERLLKSEVELASLLELYGQVRAGKRVAADETSALVDVLRLSGIVRVVDDERPTTNDQRGGVPSAIRRRSSFVVGRSSARLAVRNQIYAQVFDRAWVAANMPDAEVRRQRAAYHKALVRAGAVASVIVAVIGGLALSAVRLAEERQKESERVHRLLYVADMNVAQQALSEGNLERAEELLDEHRPEKADGAELRGFEWRYLWRLCQEDALATFHANAGTVWSAVYSPDGRLRVVVNEGTTLQLWDVATKERVTTLQTRVPDRGHWNPMAFSPDRKILAVMAPGSTPRNWVTTLWDVGTQRPLTTVSRSALIVTPVFSPDGKFLALSHGSPESFPDTTATLRTIGVWDVSTGQEVATLKQPRRFSSIAFSPDGKTIAGAFEGGRVGLWNFAATREAALMLRHKDGAWTVAFSPDGKRLATCGADETVRLWDRVTRRVVATLKGSLGPIAHNYSYRLMAFSPDGKKLATAGDSSSSVTLWDLDRKQKTHLRGHKKSVRSLAFAPDSETLATASMDGTVKLWSATPRREGTALGRLRSDVLAVAFAPASQTLATGDADGTVALWSAASGTAVAALPGHRGAVESVAFSPDGKLLASGGSDRTVRLWRVASRRPVATLKGHKDHVRCVSFSPDGETLASGGDDGAVKLWDIARATSGAKGPAREIDTLETGAVMSLSFSPDGKRLALGTNENSVKVWDVTSRQEVDSLLAHTSSVTATAFSPDGKVLASGSGGTDRTVVLWDVADRQPLWTLKGCKGRINSVAFSPDGKTLVSGSSDSSVRLWNVATGREAGTLKGPGGPVACVAFAPDGNALAAVGKDRVVRLWRAAAFAETDGQRVAAKAASQPR